LIVRFAVSKTSISNGLFILARWETFQLGGEEKLHHITSFPEKYVGPVNFTPLDQTMRSTSPPPSPEKIPDTRLIVAALHFALSILRFSER